jgi:hypothetical protein
MQLKIIKCDGSVEEYLHTKVIGTFNNALTLAGKSNVYAAEQFAEAVTYHLYREKTAHAITSDEVHLMVESVLNATGYYQAGHLLSEHRLTRKLKRKRIEVYDDKQSAKKGSYYAPCQWDKSCIGVDLAKKNGLSRQMARVIASSVEDKILTLEMLRVSRQLIKQLVIADMDSMLEAHKQLHIIAG